MPHNSIVSQSGGTAYVTGSTWSLNFPTTPGAFDRIHNGYYDAFVVRLSAAGSDLAYATFLGGRMDDEAYGIAVDRSGAAYITGSTWSPDFPATPDAFDGTCGTDGNCNFDGQSSYYGDAFVAKLNANGTALTYATFLGGGEWDLGAGIAVDGSGVAYVAGWTRSSEFPTTPGAFDMTFNGGVVDVFIVKLNATGSALSYATFFGGSSFEEGHAIAVDGSGVAYTTGQTGSFDFPTTPGAVDTVFNGGDAFVVKLALGADLVSAKSGNNMVLTWTHRDSTVQHYEVYRSTDDPYFEPGDPNVQKLGDVMPPAPGSTVSYTDEGVLGSSAAMYFYRVWGVDAHGLSYPIANPVGAFNFALTPGGN